MFLRLCTFAHVITSVITDLSSHVQSEIVHPGGWEQKNKPIAALSTPRLWHLKVCTELNAFKFSKTLELRYARSRRCCVVKHVMQS